MQDYEYQVDRGDKSSYFKHFDSAAAEALSIACSCGEAAIDVLVYSEEGARSYGGDDAVERYLEDPHASVFERIQIKVNMMGRVP